MSKIDVKQYSNGMFHDFVRVGNSSIETCCWYYYGVLYSFVCSTISRSHLPLNLVAEVFNFTHTTKVSLVRCLLVFWDQRTFGSTSFRSENQCTKYQYLFVNSCFHSFFHCHYHLLYWHRRDEEGRRTKCWKLMSNSAASECSIIWWGRVS